MRPTACVLIILASFSGCRGTVDVPTDLSENAPVTLDADSAPVTVTYSFMPHDTYRYRMIFDVETTLIQGDDRARNRNVLEFITLWRVVGRDPEGVATVEISFDDVTATVVRDGQSYKLPPPGAHDGQAGGAGVFYDDFYNILKGVKLTYRIGLSGEVIDMRGFERFSALAMKAFSKKINNAYLRRRFEREFSKDALETRFDQTKIVFPEKTIRTGDTWTKTARREMAGLPISIKTTYRVNAVTEEKASLGTTFEFATDTSAGNLLEIGKGDGSGVVVFDVKRGIPSFSETRLTLSVVAGPKLREHDGPVIPQAMTEAHLIIRNRTELLGE